MTTASEYNPYPLEALGEDEVDWLCKVLWSWPVCDTCAQGQGPPCSTAQCPWKRKARLSFFIDYYRAITSLYIPTLSSRVPALVQHEDLFAIIEALVSKHNLPRKQLAREHFAPQGLSSQQPSSDDQSRAIGIAVATVAMINCSIDRHTLGLIDFKSKPVPWPQDKSFTQFLESVFPTREHPSLDEDLPVDPNSIKARLSAKSLKKVANAKFVGTPDLRHHMRINQKNGEVEIFHHTSLLKEILIATKEQDKP